MPYFPLYMMQRQRRLSPEFQDALRPQRYLSKHYF